MGYLIIGGLFITVGVLIKHAKWHFLIAGYNTASKQDKKKVDIGRAATFMRNVFVLIGFGLICAYFVSKWLDYAVIAEIAFYVLVPGGAILLLIRSQAFIK